MRARRWEGKVGWRREAGQSPALPGPEAAAQQGRREGQMGGKRRGEKGVDNRKDGMKEKLEEQRALYTRAKRRGSANPDRAGLNPKRQRTGSETTRLSSTLEASTRISSMYTSELGPKLAKRYKRPEVPHPDDGVCPTLQQFNETAAASYELWNNLINSSGHDPGAQDTSMQLKSLLRNVPPFQAAPSRCRFLTIEGPHLLLKCSSKFLTTNDSDCDQRFKITHHHQTLGISSPVVYECLERSESYSFWQGPDSDRPNFLSELIFAWSYILSSRWVETLKLSGEDVQLHQDEEISAHNFWTVILNHKWHAAIHRGGKTYQAPWTLKKLGANSRYI